MKYIIQPSTEGKSVTIKSHSFLCLTKKQLKQRHPGKSYEIVAEAKRALRNWEGYSNQAVYDANTSLAVESYRHNFRLFWREAGYLQIGKGQYLAVLKPQLLLWLLLGLAGLLLIGGLIWMSLSGNQSDDPMSTDPHLEPMPSQPTQPADPTEPGEAGGNILQMTYVLEAKTSLASGEIGIYFANPQSSTVDVILELYVKAGDQDLLLAKSGKILPGYSLARMEAQANVLARLKLGQYPCYYRLLCYNSESGQKTLVEPRIDDVVLTVIQ